MYSYDVKKTKTNIVQSFWSLQSSLSRVVTKKGGTKNREDFVVFAILS